MAGVPVPGFFDTAAVYAPDDDNDGSYTILLNDSLTCLLSGAHKYEAATAKDRAEMAAWRQLLWDATYEMPENVQVEVDGVRYNAVPGSFVAFKVGPANILYRRGDFVRVLS